MADENVPDSETDPVAKAIRVLSEIACEHDGSTLLSAVQEVRMTLREEAKAGRSSPIYDEIQRRLAVIDAFVDCLDRYVWDIHPSMWPELDEHLASAAKMNG
jgi:hypothetical protein